MFFCYTAPITIKKIGACLPYEFVLFFGYDMFKKNLLIGLLCAMSFVAHAGSFSITPLRATLSAGQKVSSFTVTNSGHEATTIQLQTMSWTQDAEGKDVLVPTTDLLANPPIFTIAPQSKQVIRVGLRRPITENQEVTYRLLLNETPPALKPDFMGVNFALRMSVPLFIKPKNMVVPKLQWALFKNETALLLKAENTGNAHSQVISIELKDHSDKTLYKQLISNYLLPTQKRQWPIPTDMPIGSTLKLLVETDGKPIEQNITVQ